MNRLRARARLTFGRRQLSCRPQFGVEAMEGRWLLAATFYVAEAGNDAADGLSPATAWRSVARANQQDFEPGDQLLFEGGKTFTLPPAAGAGGATFAAHTISSGSATTYTQPLTGVTPGQAYVLRLDVGVTDA